MQEDITDVKHRLHPCTVLFNVSLQVLQSRESKKPLEMAMVVGGSALKGPHHTQLPAQGAQWWVPFHLGSNNTDSHLRAALVLLTQSLSTGNNGDLFVELCVCVGGRIAGHPPLSPEPQRHWGGMGSTPYHPTPRASSVVWLWGDLLWKTVFSAGSKT